MHHAAPTQALPSSSHAQPSPHASPCELQPSPSLSAAHNNKCAPFRLYHSGLPHTLLTHQPRRVQAQYGSAAVKQRPGTALDDGLDPNSIPVDVNAIPLGARTAKAPCEPVPEVEWWDRALLPGAKGEQQYTTSMSEDGQEVRALQPCLVCAQLPVLQRWMRCGGTSGFPHTTSPALCLPCTACLAGLWASRATWCCQTLPVSVHRRAHCSHRRG